MSGNLCSPDTANSSEDGSISESDDDTVEATAGAFLRTEHNTATPTRSSLSTVAPDSVTSLLWSSPIIGTRQEQTEIRKRKAKKKREREAAARMVEVAPMLAREQEKKKAFLSNILRSMQEHSYTVYDLMEFVFNPQYGQGESRWNGFFRIRGAATRVLNWWNSSRNSSTAKAEVGEWAIDFVERTVASEAKKVTKEGFLKASNQQDYAEMLPSFSLDTMSSQLYDDSARVMMRVMQAFSRGPRAKTHTKFRRAREKTITAAAAISCLGIYNYRNNLFKKVFGLYLYTTGAQRQVISVAAHLGLSESYSTLVEKGSMKSDITPDEAADIVQELSDPMAHTTEKLKQNQRKPGTLRRLSNAMREATREVAASITFATVYDNINFMARKAEQVIGRHDTQENGTCATVFPLWKAKPEDMNAAELRSAFDKAGPLELKDLEHTEDERKLFKLFLVHTICRIAVKFGNREGFQRLETELDKHQPSSQLIELHKTELYPLPTMHIDESTIVGNAEVDAAIVAELQLSRFDKFWNRVRILAGDQLSLARIRAIQNLRAGNEGGYASFDWAVLMPGLFHSKIADMHGFFTTHFGKPSTGTSNPGSLQFHNTRLNRLPITPTSLPNFRVCRDLVFVSLYARILHCLLLVSGVETLDDYADNLDWNTLYSHATLVLERYANTEIVDEMRERRKYGTSTEWDMVHENAILFNRDALISRLFTDVVKRGDSGGALLVLKTWALSFRGNGRTKYAYEMLHLIHNLTSVWPVAIRNIVLNNWLVNPTGLINRWLEVDLMQEHENFWIKVFYKARGSNVSWGWLAMISPCINVLRQLANHMKLELGSDIGSKHAPAMLKRDIDTLITSLNDHNVYRIEKGRSFKGENAEESICVDVISTGYKNLTDSTNSPLTDYNASFCRLQVRKRRRPLVGEGSQVRVTVAGETQPVPPASGCAATSDSTSNRDIDEQAPAPDNGLDQDGVDLSQEGEVEDEEEREDEGEHDDEGERDESDDEGESVKVLEGAQDLRDPDLEADEATLGLDNEEDVDLDMDGDGMLDDAGMDGLEDILDLELNDEEEPEWSSESERDASGSIDEDIFT